MNLVKIKSIATERDVSLASLAETIGMTYQNLNRCIRLGEIKMSDLEKIADVLKVPISDFLVESKVNDDMSIYNIGYKNQIIKGDNSKIANADQLKEIEFLKRENDQLKQQLADKQKLIEIYERELSNISKKN